MQISNTQFFIYLLVMAGTTYLVRALPFALIRKKIKNKYICSFLHYIPYTVLTVMTIPAVFLGANSIVATAVGMFVATLVAILSQNLLATAIAASLGVYISQFIISLL